MEGRPTMQEFVDLKAEVSSMRRLLDEKFGRSGDNGTVGSMADELLAVKSFQDRVTWAAVKGAFLGAGAIMAAAIGLSKSGVL
jgi:hypothetical protein